MVVIDAVVRLVPGVLGDEESNRQDSFSGDPPLLEFPQYTRPREYRGLEVPEVLTTGNHPEIAAWRDEQKLKRTRERRSDLLSNNDPPHGGSNAARRNNIMSQQILEMVEKSSLKAEVPEFSIGDVVDVHTKILEGDKERIQIFSGVVIARSGSGTREMFTVRRMVANEGVERKFPLHSPRIAKIEVKRSGIVKRAKLYFLRGRSGKSVRLKERRREEV